MSTSGLTEGQKRWREEVAADIAADAFRTLNCRVNEVFYGPHNFSGDKEPSDYTEFKRLVAAGLIGCIKQEWGVL